MDGGGDGGEPHGPRRVVDGPWSGWMKWENDPFETQSGPFHFRQETDGAIRCAMRAERRHMNGGGFMHGGAMMTFADFSLFALANTTLEGRPAVTVSLNGEFLGPAQEGDLVEATGEVTQAGRSLVFVRGLVTAEARPMLTFSGVIKRVRPRSPAAAAS